MSVFNSGHPHCKTCHSSDGNENNFRSAVQANSQSQYLHRIEVSRIFPSNLRKTNRFYKRISHSLYTFAQEFSNFRARLPFFSTCYRNGVWSYMEQTDSWSLVIRLVCELIHPCFSIFVGLKSIVSSIPKIRIFSLSRSIFLYQCQTLEWHFVQTYTLLNLT